MMPIPKPEFGDFYRFLMSIGIILIALPFVTLMLLADEISAVSSSNVYLVIFVLFAVSAASGIGISYWAGTRWFTNQRHLDTELLANAKEAERKIRKMTDDEKNEEIREDIKDDAAAEDASTSASQVSSGSATQTASSIEERIGIFKGMTSNSNKFPLFQSVEESALRYLSKFYPNMESHVAVDTSRRKIRVDAIVYGKQYVTVIEIKTFRNRILPASLQRIVWVLQRHMEAVGETLSSSTYPMDVHGILVIVSDFRQLSDRYRKGLDEQVGQMARETKTRLETVTLDLRDLDIWDSHIPGIDT